VSRMDENERQAPSKQGAESSQPEAQPTQAQTGENEENSDV